MELFKIIREKKGWNQYEMSKALRIGQTTLKHYEDKPISSREILLVKLYKLSGLSLERFWDLLCKEASKHDRAKRDDLKTPTEADL